MMRLKKGAAFLAVILMLAAQMGSALWQTWDGRVGGILAYAASGLDVTFEDCISSPVMNVYNDATGNNQWFVYRYCGMLIGEVVDKNNITIKIENTKVAFDSWNKYRYCEFEELGQGSYNEPDEWKYTRTDSGSRYLPPGHTHRDFEDHERLIPFTNVIGYAPGTSPECTWPGVTVVNEAYYFPVRQSGPVQAAMLPQTGDDSRPMLWMGLAAAAAMCAAAVLLPRRKMN